VRLRGALSLIFIVAVAGASSLIATVAVAAFAFSSGVLARRGAEPDTHAATSSHLQVTEVEYRLILSRGVVKTGPVDLEAIDVGMDPHDLRLRHSGTAPEIAAPELTSGRRWDGVVDLKPGVYHLWCSLPEHARLGMHATLRVVR
jgi:hypothetical protein